MKGARIEAEARSKTKCSKNLQQIAETVAGICIVDDRSKSLFYPELYKTIIKL